MSGRGQTIGRGIPLRWRLMAGLVAITALAFAVAGAATALSLSAYLNSQAVSALESAQGRISEHEEEQETESEHEGETARPAPTGADLRQPGSFAALVRDGVVVSFTQIPSSDEHPDQGLSAGDITFLSDLRPGSRAQVEIQGEPYLAGASADPGGATLIVGIPIHEIGETVGRLVLFETIAFLAALAGVAVVGWFLIRLSLRPLERVAAAAHTVSQADLAHGSVRLDEQRLAADSRTEVGQVAQAFNEMVAHVETSVNLREAAERRRSQFVADAGHELRTPLASIRGYAELLRNAGSHEYEIDPQWAVSIESAAARMGLLVEDLLLLASLDEGRPLHPEQFDVCQSLATLVADAAVAGPDHEWSYVPVPRPIMVETDRGLVEQVLANLLSNARVHTPPGTRVTATAAIEDRQVVLAVNDDGPGIPPDLLTTVTDRFARADSSRSRARGGSGLGLAIASAIAGACGGELRVTSPVTAARGTRVELRIPLTSPA